MILLALAPLVLASAIALVAVSMREHPSFEGGMVDPDRCHCQPCSQAFAEKLVESRPAVTAVEGSLIAA